MGFWTCTTHGTRVPDYGSCPECQHQTTIEELLDEQRRLLERQVRAQEAIAQEETAPTAAASGGTGALCKCCSRKFDESTRIRPKAGRAWDGVVARFREDGICPRCYTEHALERNCERMWTEDEWCVYREKELRLRQSKLETLLRTSGATRADTLSALAQLGCALAAQGFWIDALDARRSAWEGRVALYGRIDSRALASQMNLACSAEDNGDIDHALRLVDEVVTVRARTLANDDRKLSKARRVLARLLRKTGRVEAAERLLVDLKTIAGAQSDRDLLFRVRFELGGIHREQGSLERAEEAIRDVLDCYRRTLELEQDDRSCMAVSEVLADILWQRGKLHEASHGLRESQPFRRTVLGATHPFFRRCETMLAEIAEGTAWHP